MHGLLCKTPAQYREFSVRAALVLGVVRLSSCLTMFPDLAAQLIHGHGVVRAVVITRDDVEVVEPEPVLRASRVL